MSQQIKDWFPKWNCEQPSKEFLLIMESQLKEAFYVYFGKPNDWEILWEFLIPQQALVLGPSFEFKEKGGIQYYVSMKFGGIHFKALIIWYSTSLNKEIYPNFCEIPEDLRIYIKSVVYEYYGLFISHKLSQNELNQIPEIMLVKKIGNAKEISIYWQGEENPEKIDHFFCLVLVEKNIDPLQLKTIIMREYKLNNHPISKEEESQIQAINPILVSSNGIFSFHSKASGSEASFCLQLIKTFSSLSLPIRAAIFGKTRRIYEEADNKPPTRKFSKGNFEAQKKFVWLSCAISEFNFSYDFASKMDKQLRKEIEVYFGMKIKFGNKTLFGIGCNENQRYFYTDGSLKKWSIIEDYLSIGSSKIKLIIGWYAPSSNSYISGKEEISPEDIKFKVFDAGSKEVDRNKLSKFCHPSDLVSWNLGTYFPVLREFNLDGSEGWLRIKLTKRTESSKIMKFLENVINEWNEGDPLKTQNKNRSFFKYIIFEKVIENYYYFSYDAGTSFGSHIYIAKQLSVRYKGIEELAWLNDFQ
ncbi:MAG: hypothetical protein EA362_11970 [Saprospirales bacterium]|nr:MAG: hypothetical protein EA362_11970 [Saprospirales bacterium]